MNARLMLAGAVVVAAAAGLSAAPDPSFDKAIAIPLVELRTKSAVPKPVGAAVERVSQRGRPGPGRDRDRPDRGGSRREACHGFDKGWEEHWSGHGGLGYAPEQACGACKKPTGPHGECTYRCTIARTQCRAIFERRDGGRGWTYDGRPEYDRYDAEDSALSRCRDDNWHDRTGGRCRIESCSPANETTKSGRCQ